MHKTACAFVFALPSAGSSVPAKIAMIAMTTSNSIKVKPERRCTIAERGITSKGIRLPAPRVKAIQLLRARRRQQSLEMNARDITHEMLGPEFGRGAFDMFVGLFLVAPGLEVEAQV